MTMSVTETVIQYCSSNLMDYSFVTDRVYVESLGGRETLKNILSQRDESLKL